ncbi:type I-U CRISPR-associated protein Csx17 [Calothrix membranacea FACHB-236]|nr:type I-U CRISPR-associated protein Csx17 [Calothrix membranacea FACHB-236]
MPEIILLPGCTAEPLSNYLKALGVLRLVVEQKKDPTAKGCWRNNSFALIANLSQDELLQFFLQDYQPTPLVAPWNGSTGFYPKDNKKTIEAILNSQTKRLADYRETVHSAQKQVDDLQLTAQPKDKDEKKKLLTKLRNNLPDKAVKWLDTCTLINSSELKFPPLTGTGGNDGNFEFSRTFMQQLQELLDFQSGAPKENAKLLLQASLFDATVPGLSFAGKIGQFNPIAAGGANAAPGYDADSRVNPWDYVLMLEGIMLFTSGATRRYEQSESADFAYPFTVRPSNIGYGSAADGDEARAELWTPLWSAPTGLKELELLFNEGRAKVGGRTARDGVDFARAISSQGEQRGIDEFTRYSFQVRNGLSYFAIPLGRFQPIVNPQVDRLVELDGWLSYFKRAVSDANAPASVKRAHRRLETAFFELSVGKKPLLDVLIALGEVEAALDRSLRFTKDKFLQPIPELNSQWIQDCNDLSTEFRLALALVGRGLRQRLVRVRKNKQGRNEWLENDDSITTWQVGTLETNLIALLRRIAIESEQNSKQQEENLNTESKTEWTFPQAQLDDIVRWIHGDVDDARIEEIARGLSLAKLPQERPKSSLPALPIPTAYALVAIVHHRTLKRDALQKVFQGNTQAQDLTLPTVPTLLGKLAVGDCYTATGLAARRLYASGLNPAITDGVFEPSDRTRRIAAALAFPISDVNIARLLKQIKRLDPNTDSQE